MVVELGVLIAIWVCSQYRIVMLDGPCEVLLWKDGHFLCVVVMYSSFLLW